MKRRASMFALLLFGFLSMIFLFQNFTLPISGIQAQSDFELIFTNNINSEKAVWNATLAGDTKFEKRPLSEVFQMDPAPFTAMGGEREMVFTNYKCSSPGLGLHLSPTEIQEGFQNSWCQRLFFDPSQSPKNWFGYWSQGTRATWSGHHVSMGSGQFLAMIGFTENKTTPAWNGTMGRGPAPYEFWGYTNYKMNGSPVNPWNTIEGALDDGYYMGFVTINLLSVSSNNGWGANNLGRDLGPIAWPRRGYRKWNPSLNGGVPTAVGLWQQTSMGLRHPTSFVNGQYLYVYYLGHNGVQDGKWDSGYNGIYVARSLLSSGLKPGTFKCGKDFSENCLPAGFSVETREKFEASLALEGPIAKPIIADEHAVSFAVARIRNTNSYIGVLEVYDGKRGSVKLLKSSDLVNWSDAIEVSESVYYGGYYQDGKIHYPSLLSLDGKNDSIDSTEFFLIGTDARGCPSWPCKLVRMKLKSYGNWIERFSHLFGGDFEVSTAGWNVGSSPAFPQATLELMGPGPQNQNEAAVGNKYLRATSHSPNQHIWACSPAFAAIGSRLAVSAFVRTNLSSYAVEVHTRSLSGNWNSTTNQRPLNKTVSTDSLSWLYYQFQDLANGFIFHLPSGTSELTICISSKTPAWISTSNKAYLDIDAVSAATF